MKDNYVNITFVIDESGSMYSSKEDVIGGFKKMIDEQKQEKNGTCTISLYRFATTVEKDFIGKDVNDIKGLEYSPNGLTAMNDGIGTAIKEVGEWLANMKEEDRPSKNIFVIMTDGAENNSRKYSFHTVREMIKHQEEKYNWTFIYMGMDLSNREDVDKLGIKMSRFSNKSDLSENYSMISQATCLYRSCSSSVEAQATMDWMQNECDVQNAKYEADNGVKITK